MCRLAAILVFLGASISLAQQPNPLHQQEMKKLAFLAGKWEGPATIVMGREGKSTVRQTEDVQYRLGGTVLLIEGTGRGKLADQDKEGIIFNALAVISYDPALKKHRIKAYRMEGTSVETDVNLTKNGFTWGFEPRPGMKVLYTMTLTDKGEWNEVGKYTMDDKTWMNFFDMTLTKIKE